MLRSSEKTTKSRFRVQPLLWETYSPGSYSIYLFIHGHSPAGLLAERRL